MTYRDYMFIYYAIKVLNHHNLIDLKFECKESLKDVMQFHKL